jgi:hypothetical protein
LQKSTEKDKYDVFIDDESTEVDDSDLDESVRDDTEDDDDVTSETDDDVTSAIDEVVTCNSDDDVTSEIDDDLTSEVDEDVTCNSDDDVTSEIRTDDDVVKHRVFYTNTYPFFPLENGETFHPFQTAKLVVGGRRIAVVLRLQDGYF